MSGTIIEKTILNKLLTKVEFDFDDLPEDDLINPIVPMPINELKMREEEFQTLKNQLWEIILKNSYELDYHVMKDNDLLTFLKKVVAFYSLAFGKKIHVDDIIQMISDPDRNVRSFTARSFTTNQKGVSSKNEKSR